MVRHPSIGSTLLTLSVRALSLGLTSVLLGGQALSPAVGEDLETDALWHYGAYLDVNYAPDLSTPYSVPFRDKLTTTRLNQVSPDLVMAYVSKDATRSSPFGFEFGLMTGWDMSGQMPTSNVMGGASVIEHLARANVSYQTDVGNGLRWVGGLMSSFIGYESFYAKDNINYSRAWGSDYSPYYLIGVGALYPLRPDIDLGFYLVTDYNYLQVINDQPKYAGQFVYRLTDRLKWSENLFVGPEQENTDFRYWRGFFNSMLEYDDGDRLTALVMDVGTQKKAGGNEVQQLYAAAALYNRWRLSGPFSLGLRPELYYDPNGLQTGNIQFIKALTTTLEYKVKVAEVTTQVRLEYRFDNSTGTEGGFYQAGGTRGPLTPSQSVIFLGLLLSFDDSFTIP